MKLNCEKKSASLWTFSEAWRVHKNNNRGSCEWVKSHKYHIPVVKDVGRESYHVRDEDEFRNVWRYVWNEELLLTSLRIDY